MMPNQLTDDFMQKPLTDGFPRCVHFVGAGGIGVSALAMLLASRGHRISGSDQSSSKQIRALAAMGAKVWVGHDATHLPSEVETVVISAAIPPDNPEVREARLRGIPVLKYAQALGRLMQDRFGIAVCGAHGKTTTTALTGTVLMRGGLDPSVIVGGRVPLFGGNCRVGGGKLLVVEACEYDRSFLNLSPKIIIMTNVDRDHLDYYADIDEIEDAFREFAERVPADGLVVANADDPRAMRAASGLGHRTETYGKSPDANWRVLTWSRRNGRSFFEVGHDGRLLGEFVIRPPGFHNVCNSLAVIAVAQRLGVGLDDLREGLAMYTGTERRFHLLGEIGGVTVIDDYAHHPTEVRATLEAARMEFPGRRLLCVFQPHQHSRTRLLMDAFAHAFGAADYVFVPDIYSARDTEEDRRLTHATELVRRLRDSGVNAEYVATFQSATERVLELLAEGDVLVTMGAGPVDEVAHLVIRELTSCGVQEIAQRGKFVSGTESFRAHTAA